MEEAGKREVDQVMDELERFFTVNPDLFCITDPEGRFLRVNSSWKSVLGYSREDLEKERFGGLCHPDDSFSHDTLQESGSNDEAVVHLGRIRHINGTYCLIEWRTRLFGNLLYSSGKDITDNKKIDDALIPGRPEEKIRDCKPLILIAEDVMVNMELAQLMIRQIMPEVRFISAVNGEDAVTAFREHKPDLVLMDIHMPVKDGYSAAADIREYSDATGRRVPVIALTARVLDGERQRCLRSGMVDIITKPIDIGALQKVLVKYFDGDKVKDGPPVVQDNETQDIKGKIISSPTSIDKIRTSLFLKEDRKIAKFIKMALPSLKNEMGYLEKAAGSRDFENIEAAAHKIRGLALNFSCEELALLAEKLEGMKPGFRDELTILLEKTGKEVIRVEETFHEILETIKSKEYNGIE